MAKHKHLGMAKVAECSMHPEYECPTCKKKLWTERSQRSNWKEWLITEDGRRHFKSRCHEVALKPL